MPTRATLGQGPRADSFQTLMKSRDDEPEASKAGRTAEAISLQAADKPVHRSGSFAIGGDLSVDRLGYGAMRIAGPGIWDPPEDPEGAKAFLRQALELGWASSIRQTPMVQR
jgi:hypothetical protein